MKHVFVGDCPLCGKMRSLHIDEDGRWEPIVGEGGQETLSFVPTHTVITARCPDCMTDAGRRWKFPAGTEWVITARVEMNEDGEEAAP